MGQVRTGAATAIFISLYGLHKAMVIPLKIAPSGSLNRDLVSQSFNSSDS